MAQYTLIGPPDPNLPVLNLMDHEKKQYVVTYAPTFLGTRAVFGTYKSSSLAFNAYKRILANFTGFDPKVIIMNGENFNNYYVNGNGNPLT